MGAGNGKAINGQRVKQLPKSPFLVDYQQDHTGSVNACAVNTDGTILATGSDDLSIRLWHIGPQTGANPLSMLTGHSRYITCLEMHENYVISGSADNTVKKWNMSTGQCEFTYEGHTGMVSRLLCTGDLIFTSSYDGTARCWLMDIGPTEMTNPAEACLRVFRGHIRGVYPIAFVPEENEDNLGIAEEVEITEDLLVTGSTDSTARIWSVESGKTMQILKGHLGPIQCLTVTDNGRKIFTGGADKTVRMWKTTTGECLKVMTGHKDGIVNLLAYQKYVFSGSSDRTCRSWVSEYGDISRVFKGHKHSVTCMTHYDGVLYTGCGDGQVRGYESKTGILLRNFKGHVASVNCIKVSSVLNWSIITLGTTDRPNETFDKFFQCSNNRLYSGAFDNTVRVWNLDEIKESDDADRFPRREAGRKDDHLIHPEDQLAAADDTAFFNKQASVDEDPVFE